MRGALHLPLRRAIASPGPFRAGGKGAYCAVIAGMMMAAVALCGPARAGAEPADAAQRIVSINLCTDELLLRLAPPENIASVSFLSRRADTSNVVAEASRVPVNHGMVEEIVGFRPDLVLAGLHTARHVVMLLRNMGVPVIELDTPVTIAGVRQQIQDVGQLLGGVGRAGAIIADFDARLPQAAPDAPRPTAIVLRASGFTTGPGSLLDDILNYAGVDNLAARPPLAGLAQPPLELVLQARPDLLILTGEEGEGAALAAEVLGHPALKKLAQRIPAVMLPAPLWTCAGPGVAEAAARLAEAVAAWRAGNQHAPQQDVTTNDGPRPAPATTAAGGRP